MILNRPPRLARAMITRYGMSDEFDMVAMETVNNQYLGGDASLACSRGYPEGNRRKGGGACKDSSMKKRKKILMDNRQEAG